MPAWVAILLLIPVAMFGILCHFYFVSRILDGFYQREIKPTREEIETIKGQLQELTA